MGGIAAIIDFREEPDRQLAEPLLRQVGFKGGAVPDRFAEGPALLAQRKDPLVSGGHARPLVTDRFVLVFDGRLYDHVDLARRVPGAGPGSPSTVRDVEVLARAWQAWGPACLSRLVGAWAIVVWDRHERALYLARDPVGVRPLHYAVQGRRLAAASLAHLVARVPWVSREVSPHNLCEYLAFRYVHAPRTLLRDVHCLPPGCVLRFDGDGTRMETFARASFGPPGKEAPSDEQGLREMDRLLRRAVARRARGLGAVGVLLSGGTDSTVLAHMAVRKCEQVHSFHLHFPGSGVDEAAFAGRVARLLGTEHHQVDLDPSTFGADLDRCTRALGVPLPDPAAVGQYALLRAARREVRVVLSGAGGDELLAGGHLSGLAMLMKQVTVVARLTSKLRTSVEEGLEAAGLSDLALRPARYGLQRLAGGTQVFDAAARANLLVAGIDPRPALRREVLLPLYGGLDTDPVNTLLAIFQRGWLAEDTLARSERLGAACGVELRFPLLDLELLRYLNSVPGTWKFRSRWGVPRPKWPMRQLLKGQVPRNIYDRPKRSWPSPLNRWLRREGADFLRARSELLLDAPWGLWRADPVREMVQAHLAGDRYHGHALWVLIMLDAWLRHLAR